ncbi:MAG: hypothetical protein RMJ19_13375 [Gemmatales bacterium]|nr:hypothetical protein [Gemmatales bacterium]MCS7161458.1 hypothetical protein [Gemmatales bacterium]MDW8176661.1 hypothetical protein [Gemmatales bacterium]MDW8223810.1 hypothetical protein [Gemmatales bacterium]
MSEPKDVPNHGEQRKQSVPPSGHPALTQRRIVSASSVDITGRVPDDVHVDPNITEGHPGYQESGESEIIPMERLTKAESGQQN